LLLSQAFFIVIVVVLLPTGEPLVLLRGEPLCLLFRVKREIVASIILVVLSDSVHLLFLLHLMHLQTSDSLDLCLREVSEILLGQVLQLLWSQAHLGKYLLCIEVFIVIHHVFLAFSLSFFAVAHLVGVHLLIHFFLFFSVVVVCNLPDCFLVLLKLLKLLEPFISVIFVTIFSVFLVACLGIHVGCQSQGILEVDFFILLGLIGSHVLLLLSH
jgi:hypothetical protein